ncbi:hypothetical protein V6Z11_D13G137100 [Gossypium hirsutum]
MRKVPYNPTLNVRNSWLGEHLKCEEKKVLNFNI